MFTKVRRGRYRASGGIDIALDLVGTDEAIEVSLELVATQIRIATIAGFGKVAGTGIKLLGGGRPDADLGAEVRDTARPELARLAGTGQLDVTVDRTFPLIRAAEAHRYLQTGHAAGKVVLLP